MDDKFGFAVPPKDEGLLTELAGEVTEEIEPFKWYRFLVTGVKSANDAGWSYNVFIRRLGLFDAQGNAVGLNMTELPPDNLDEITGASKYISSEHFHWQNLEPGQCTIGEIPYCAASSGWGNDRVQAMEYQKNWTPAELFNLDDNWFRTEMVPAIGSESGYYLPIVFRPPTGSNPIAYYDLLPFTDWDVSDHIESFKLEASVDGVTWVTLHSVSECPKRKENEWYSTGVKNVRVDGSTHEDQNCIEKGFGYKIDTGVKKTVTRGSRQLGNVANVQVASGATLETDGEVAALKALAIDAEVGGGTIKGFSFATSGVINLVNTDAAECQASVAIEEGTGTENLANWEIRMNGHKATGTAVYADGMLNVSASSTRAGALIILK